MDGPMLQLILAMVPDVAVQLAEKRITKPRDNELIALLLAENIKETREGMQGVGRKLDVMGTKLDYVRTVVEKADG